VVGDLRTRRHQEPRDGTGGRLRYDHGDTRDPQATIRFVFSDDLFRGGHKVAISGEEFIAVRPESSPVPRPRTDFPDDQLRGGAPPPGRTDHHPGTRHQPGHPCCCGSRRTTSPRATSTGAKRPPRCRPHTRGESTHRRYEQVRRVLRVHGPARSGRRRRQRRPIERPRTPVLVLSERGQRRRTLAPRLMRASPTTRPAIPRSRRSF
jgi:hypothetical protein